MHVCLRRARAVQTSDGAQRAASVVVPAARAHICGSPVGLMECLHRRAGAWQRAGRPAARLSLSLPLRACAARPKKCGRAVQPELHCLTRRSHGCVLGRPHCAHAPAAPCRTLCCGLGPGRCTRPVRARVLTDAWTVRARRSRGRHTSRRCPTARRCRTSTAEARSPLPRGKRWACSRPACSRARLQPHHTGAWPTPPHNHQSMGSAAARCCCATAVARAARRAARAAAKRETVAITGRIGAITGAITALLASNSCNSLLLRELLQLLLRI